MSRWRGRSLPKEERWAGTRPGRRRSPQPGADRRRSAEALPPGLRGLLGAPDRAGRPSWLDRWAQSRVVPERAFELLSRGRCLRALDRPTEAAPVVQHAREILDALRASPTAGTCTGWRDPDLGQAGSAAPDRGGEPAQPTSCCQVSALSRSGARASASLRAKTPRKRTPQRKSATPSPL